MDAEPKMDLAKLVEIYLRSTPGEQIVIAWTLALFVNLTRLGLAKFSAHPLLPERPWGWESAVWSKDRQN